MAASTSAPTLQVMPTAQPILPVVNPPVATPNSLSNWVAGPSQPPPYTTEASPNSMVESSLDYFLNPNSQYMQQARQQGLDYAASRGGLNSSIAAGASQKAAIDAAQPLASSALAIQNQRDQLAGQNWLDTQGFNRQIQGAMAMLPVSSAFNMLSTVQNYALQDPALYTPDVISGYSNFFQDNMQNIMNQYFNTAQGGG